MRFCYANQMQAEMARSRMLSRTLATRQRTWHHASSTLYGEPHLQVNNCAIYFFEGLIVLQITTGKFFSQPAGKENSLRGVLYTNLQLEFMNDSAIASPLFGRLIQTSELSNSPKMVVYEFTERLESPPVGSGIVISHGSDSYVEDMAMILSLFFNCTCSPDFDLVRRLIGGHPGTATRQSPQKLLSRVFDSRLFVKHGESKDFVIFLEHLLGIERKTYLGIMRAIRTYVTGLHRVADDLELAYTLMVAAAESLTQGFDQYSSTWESISEQKRLPIDQALVGADAEVAARVRATLVEIEHVGLGRRLQAFIIANISPDYFEGPFAVDSFPPGRSELPELLSAAYKARSQYIHELLQLPDMVKIGYNEIETALPIDSRQRMLTLQGLARLIRNVIMTFIRKQPVLDKEQYDYKYELAGISRVRMAANYWIANVDGDITNHGRDKLEGFLEQLVAVEMNSADATVTDISEVLNKFLTIAPQMIVKKRRPYIALLILFNSLAGEKFIPTTKQLENLFNADLAQPSSEFLLIHAVLEQTIDFSLEEHSHAFQNYKSRRGHKNGIRFPRLFEAAIGLNLAEHFRRDGDFKGCLEIAIRTADDFPEHSNLRESIGKIAENIPIKWREILLPT